MNYYHTSTGERISRMVLDNRIRKAKKEKLAEQREELGYNRCEKCKQNTCIPIDVSHNISVKEACETGRAELCYDLNNMEILGRYCHRPKDGLDLRFSKK